MKKDEIFSLWEEGNETMFRNNKIDKAMIERFITEKTLKGSGSIRATILFYWFIQVANLILVSMNLMGYAGNQVMIWILLPQVAVTIGIMIFGMDLFYKLREINNYSETIQRLIGLQLRFFRGPYEWWLVLTSLSVVILQANLNLYVDNDQGTYHIYNKVMYAGVTVGIFLFIYGLQKLASLRSLTSLKNYLSDLQKGTLDETMGMEGRKKRLIWLYVVVFILLTGFLILGIIRASG